MVIFGVAVAVMKSLLRLFISRLNWGRGRGRSRRTRAQGVDKMDNQRSYPFAILFCAAIIVGFVLTIIFMVRVHFVVFVTKGLFY